MNMQSPEELDAYYRQAASWGRDREAALQASKRTAWIIAAVASVLALLLGIAIVAMLPLKRTQVVTVLVDKQTGFAQAIDPTTPQRMSADSALTQSFLAQYVVSREGFDADTLQSNYRKVALWSGEKARDAYLARMQASNPASPLARFPRSTIVDVEIKSVSPVAPKVAMVRFDTIERAQSGRTERRSNVSMIRYRYAGEPLSLEDRLINPLGFQVVRYRSDQEAIAQSSAAAGLGAPATAAPPESELLP
jgi:type IV secretion system protein VirB8